VPGTTGTKVAYFTAGALVAGVIVGTLSGLLISSGDDEERPPIIVRGGSIVFESGDKNGKPKEKKGKKWIPAGNDWQPDQGEGIPVADLSIAIRGGNQASCPALQRVVGDKNAGEPPIITVTYTDQNQTESKFIVTAKKDKNKNKWSPTIVGSNMRLENDTTDNPQLVFGNHGQGSLTRVQFEGQNGNVDCQGQITSLKIWQDK
jgi:hypothetical protein